MDRVHSFHHRVPLDDLWPHHPQKSKKEHPRIWSVHAGEPIVSHCFYLTTWQKEQGMCTGGKKTLTKMSAGCRDAWVMTVKKLNYMDAFFENFCRASLSLSCVYVKLFHKWSVLWCFVPLLAVIKGLIATTLHYFLSTFLPQNIPTISQYHYLYSWYGYINMLTDQSPMFSPFFYFSLFGLKRKKHLSL